MDEIRPLQRGHEESVSIHSRRHETWMGASCLACAEQVQPTTDWAAAGSRAESGSPQITQEVEHSGFEFEEAAT